jgi:hypothetical protein
MHGCFSSGHLIMSSTRHSLLSRGATTLLFSALHIYLHPKQLTVFAKIYKNILTIIYTNIPINYPDASSLLSVLILLHNGLYTLQLLAAMTFAVPYYTVIRVLRMPVSVSSDDTRGKPAFVWSSK